MAKEITIYFIKLSVEWLLKTSVTIIHAVSYRLQGGVADYRLLSGSVDAKDLDPKQYDLLIAAMSRLGISKEQKFDIFATIAAILHLGNVNFTDRETVCEVSDLEGKLFLKKILRMLQIYWASLRKS